MAKAKPKKESPVKVEKPTEAPKAKKAAAKSAAPPKKVTTVTHEDIAKVAYAIWERKGRPMGQDSATWAEAKRELKAK